MAGVLVYIEHEGKSPLRSSFEALGEGRRIATALGAPLWAFSPQPEHSNELCDDLSRHGADVVAVMESPALANPGLWSAHGRALCAAVESARPLLILIAASAAGRELAPRLAAHLGAAFLAEPAIECGSQGEIVLTRTVHHGAIVQRLAAEDLGHVVVATTTPGAYTTARGVPNEGRLIILETPDLGSPIVSLSCEPDVGANLATAPVVVTAGAGAAAESDLELIRKLASALGAELGATRNLCDRNQMPHAREVGVGARHVAPRLYVTCGASGSPEHLGAVGRDATIVAINRDANAPIVRAADYALVGPISEVVPALLDALAIPPQPAERA